MTGSKPLIPETAALFLIGREKCGLGETKGFYLNQTWLDQRLRTKPCLVLFDGLDEIFEPSERERVSEEIAGFAHKYPKCRVLVTSRPVGYNEAPLRNAGFRHYGLQNFDRQQIETFVHRWFARVFDDRPEDREQGIQRILEAMESSPPIRLLAGNPMLLTIMTLIARQQELPRERWRFYQHCTNVLCHHWDVKRHLEDAGFREHISLEDKQELLQRIAFRMQSAEKGMAGNFIHRRDLEEEIEAYLQERYGTTGAEAARLARSLIDRLRKRNYILCLYGADGVDPVSWTVHPL